MQDIGEEDKADNFDVLSDNQQSKPVLIFKKLEILLLCLRVNKAVI